jgi:hypothetical protein
MDKWSLKFVSVEFWLAVILLQAVYFLQGKSDCFWKADEKADPHLDSIAHNGVYLKNTLATTARCSTSRA